MIRLVVAFPVIVAGALLVITRSANRVAEQVDELLEADRRRRLLRQAMRRVRASVGR